jgi:hypothetical protein
MARSHKLTLEDVTRLQRMFREWIKGGYRRKRAAIELGELFGIDPHTVFYHVDPSRREKAKENTNKWIARNYVAFRAQQKEYYDKNRKQLLAKAKAKRNSPSL